MVAVTVATADLLPTVDAATEVEVTVAEAAAVIRTNRL